MRWFPRSAEQRSRERARQSEVDRIESVLVQAGSMLSLHDGSQYLGGAVDVKAPADPQVAYHQELLARMHWTQGHAERAAEQLKRARSLLGEAEAHAAEVAVQATEARRAVRRVAEGSI